MAVREKGWFIQWRHTVFNNLGHVFAWRGTKVSIIGIKGDSSNYFTMEEFPTLMQDLQDGFRDGTKPLHKGSFDMVNEKRIAIDDLEDELSLAKGDKYVIIASCPNQHFEAVTRLVSDHPNRRNIMSSWGELGDASSGMARDAPKQEQPKQEQASNQSTEVKVKAEAEDKEKAAAAVKAKAATAAQFITVWNAADGRVTLPLAANWKYNVEVEWGDGTSDTVTGRPNCSHTYAKPGTYTIAITGLLDGFVFSNGGDKDKIIDITQWGSGVKLRPQMFYGCANMKCSAMDAPNLTGVTNTKMMFYDAKAFNGDISSWNVSGVTNMDYMFYGAKAFNGDISSWNVSGVQYMDKIFDYSGLQNRQPQWVRR